MATAQAFLSPSGVEARPVIPEGLLDSQTQARILNLIDSKPDTPNPEPHKGPLHHPLPRPLPWSKDRDP